MKFERSVTQVKIDNPQGLCSAGHIAAEILGRNLGRPDLKPVLEDLDVTIHFIAGRMKFTVVLKSGGAQVMEGHAGRASVRISAPFAAILRLALRSLPWRDLVLLRVRIFGNYFKLIKAAPLLVHHDPVSPELLEGG